MKKITLTILFAISVSTLVNAQSNALGIRFDAGYGTGAEASFQHFLSNTNRLEIGVGLDFDWGFRANAVYQWVWNLSELADGFKWYAGVGGGLALYDNTHIGVLGNLGIEYNFKIPLQISLDIRPGFYLLNEGSFGWGGTAFGIRYRF